MFVRNETLLRWFVYGVAALACVVLQAILQHITLLGVIPFLYPMLVAIPATYEGPARGCLFGLAVGVFCDLLLPGAFPCFYTLVFPVSALIAALVAKFLLPTGFLCSALVSGAAFLLSGLFHCFLLAVNGSPAPVAGAWVALREFCITLPLIFPLTPLFRVIHERTAEDD